MNNELLSKITNFTYQIKAYIAKQLESKADQQGGALQITDTTASNYNNISGSLTNTSTQQEINQAINAIIGALQSVEIIKVVPDKGSATKDKMNKLFIETKNNSVNIYYVKRSGTSPNYTYSWDSLDSAILSDISWDTISDKPFESVDTTIQNTNNPVTNSAINTALSGKAQKNHASSNDDYGLGSSVNYGHLKIKDSLDESTYSATQPIALSAHQGYELNAAKAPKDHADTATTYGVATDTKYGHVKIADNLTQSSHNTSSPIALSAHQGYELNAAITNIINGTTNLDKYLTNVDFIEAINQTADLFSSLRVYGADYKNYYPNDGTSLTVIIESDYTSSQLGALKLYIGNTLISNSVSIGSYTINSTKLSQNSSGNNITVRVVSDTLNIEASVIIKPAS